MVIEIKRLIVFTYCTKSYPSDCVIILTNIKKLYYLWISLARTMKLNNATRLSLILANWVNFWYTNDAVWKCNK